MSVSLTAAQQAGVTKLLEGLGDPEKLRAITSRDEPHDTHVFVEVYRNTDHGWTLVCEVIVEGDGSYEPPPPTT